MACRRKEPATDLYEQFKDFASMMDSGRDGTTIDLLRSDYWLLQAKVIDNKRATLADTTISFNKFIPPPPPPPPEPKHKKKKKAKEEEIVIVIRPNDLNYKQWLKFLRHLCQTKDLCIIKTKELLTQCGVPGHKAPPLKPYYFYIPNTKWPNEIIYKHEHPDDDNPDASESLVA